MAIYEHAEEYVGLPVATFNEDTGTDDDGDGRGTAADPVTGDDFPPAGEAAWFVGTSFDEEPFAELFARFLRTIDTAEITALIIGYWGASYDDGAADPVALLTEAAASFPRLRSLFLGEITAEEAEISWIEHADITPLFAAFPELERFEVRGAQGLVLDPVKSDRLKVLRFESGGLPARIVRAVGSSELPNLEHLDLWLGEDNYGGDATVADLAPFLGGERLPALRHLGLEDSELQDEIAAAVAGAPVVARLESLSLAMGVLTDQGAEALLSGQPLTHLRKLDLHHHFLSDGMVERVKAALPGVEVDLGDQEKPHGDWHYIAVSE
ncbi:leucine-rich repeat domain-containing protein [Actinomadura darangshiensis]|uniref:Leucine-rich repeat domain-containing protein n=1 Tax=Actinomadura darangshiensis TaxID=705336 RepID=A0A4R5AS76_9ACTN|nr:STM4015 family protein [Actinomadura darangshiensis]TDD73262.1 leucine-rich repeat domain-containing protein [Actinomadura darangshiensis]